MKKFLKYVLIFFIPILLLGASSEVLLRNIPNDYRYKKNYLDSNSGKISVLILGNSHTFRGINPDYISQPAFNAAYISQSLDIDYEILKKYSKKWEDLKYIILNLDYTTLFSRLEDGVESWRIKNYNIYFGMHLTLNPVNYSEILSNDLGVNSDRLDNYYLRNIPNNTCSKLGWGNTTVSENEQELILSGKAAAARHLSTDNKNFNKNIKTLKDIIEFAKVRNIGIVMCTPPAYKTYYTILNKNQLLTTMNVATELASSYDNVKYLNFLEDTSFIAEDFYDADHLNANGAKKLTLKIDPILKGMEN